MNEIYDWINIDAPTSSLDWTNLRAWFILHDIEVISGNAYFRGDNHSLVVEQAISLRYNKQINKGIKINYNNTSAFFACDEYNICIIPAATYSIWNELGIKLIVNYFYRYASQPFDWVDAMLYEVPSHTRDSNAIQKDPDWSGLYGTTRYAVPNYHVTTGDIQKRVSALGLPDISTETQTNANYIFRSTPTGMNDRNLKEFAYLNKLPVFIATDFLSRNSPLNYEFADNTLHVYDEFHSEKLAVTLQNEDDYVVLGEIECENGLRFQQTSSYFNWLHFLETREGDSNRFNWGWKIDSYWIPDTNTDVGFFIRWYKLDDTEPSFNDKTVLNAMCKLSSPGTTQVSIGSPANYFYVDEPSGTRLDGSPSKYIYWNDFLPNTNINTVLHDYMYINVPKVRLSVGWSNAIYYEAPWIYKMKYYTNIDYEESGGQEDLQAELNTVKANIQASDLRQEGENWYITKDIDDNLNLDINGILKLHPNSSAQPTFIRDKTITQNKMSWQTGVGTVYFPISPKPIPAENVTPSNGNKIIICIMTQNPDTYNITPVSITSKTEITFLGGTYTVRGEPPLDVIYNSWLPSAQITWGDGTKQTVTVTPGATFTHVNDGTKCGTYVYKFDPRDN